MILMPYTIGGVCKRTKIDCEAMDGGRLWWRAVADEDLRPGDLLGVFHGPICLFKVTPTGVDYGDVDGGYVLDLHLTDEWLVGMLVGWPRQKYVGGPVSPVEVMNHSCTPNCEMSGPHKLTVVAREHISSGQELTIDYRTFTIVPTGQQCSCATGIRGGFRCVI